MNGDTMRSRNTFPNPSVLKGIMQNFFGIRCSCVLGLVVLSGLIGCKPQETVNEAAARHKTLETSSRTFKVEIRTEPSSPTVGVNTRFFVEIRDQSGDLISADVVRVSARLVDGKDPKDNWTAVLEPSKYGYLATAQFKARGTWRLTVDIDIGKDHANVFQDVTVK